MPAKERRAGRAGWAILRPLRATPASGGSRRTTHVAPFEPSEAGDQRRTGGSQRDETKGDVAVDHRTRRRRFGRALLFTALFFAGGALSALAGDVISEATGTSAADTGACEATADVAT